MQITKTLPILITMMLLASNTAFAIPNVTSGQNQNFVKHQASAQLKNISITDDTEEAYIEKGEIKIIIPDNIAMIYQTQRTLNEIVLYGSAVDNGKVLSDPEISFKNDDKSLVIPIEEDFAPGEELVIKGAYVEGFNATSSEQARLVLQINNQSIGYTDGAYKYIGTSSNVDDNEPDVPENVLIQDDENGVKITWGDPTDLDLKTIKILRGKNGAPIDAGTPHAIIDDGIEEYIDTDVEQGDTVNYILRGSDGRNTGDNSEEVSFVVGSSLVDDDDDVDDTDEVCTLDYTPVCGIDGVTYANQCTAESEGVEIASEGECEDTSDDDSDADDDSEDDTSNDDGDEDDLADDTADDDSDDDDAADDDTSDDDTDTTPTITFTDVAEDHWAYNEITLVAENEIIKGDSSSNTFRPDDGLNRAEAAAMLFRVLGFDEPEIPESETFSDVPTNEWYAGYIAQMAEIEIVNGKTETTYAPNEKINRAEFIVLAMNTYNYLNISLQSTIDSPFQDELPDWAEPLILEAAELGYISGKDCDGGKCFNASEAISRAEAAAIIKNIFYSSEE